MKKTTKQRISILVVALMLCAMIAVPASAAEVTNTYVELKVEIPAGTTAMVEYYLNAFRIPNTVKFEVGDKLVYDVWMSEAAPGVGGLTLINGGLNLHDSGALDKDGNNVHTSFDISGFCTETWYTREITLPENMIMDFASFSDFAFDVLPGINIHPDVVGNLAGKTITVRYDNIKLVAADGTVKHTVFDEGQTLGTNPLVHNQVATITPAVGTETIIVDDPAKTGDNLFAVILAAGFVATAGAVLVIKRKNI